MNRIIGTILFLALASSVAAQHIPGVSVTSTDAPAIPDMVEVPT